jgi:hypothetical protein
MGVIRLVSLLHVLRTLRLMQLKIIKDIVIDEERSKTAQAA